MSIKKKIILLVGALSVVTAVVGWAGIVGLERVAEAAAEMNRVGEDAALAEQLTQDVIHISRGEYRIAADPTPENIEEVEKNIAADRAQLEARLAKLKASPDPAVQELVGEVDAALAAYMAKMTETLDKSRKFGTKFTSTALQAIIRQATRASFAAATSLEDAARKLNDHFRVRTAELLAQATAEKEATQRLMLLAALIGITLAAAGGVAAAQGTIVRPIMQSVDCLRRLAQGEADIEVYGLGRRDEIGSIAGAMQAFKESLQRNAQLRAEAERLQLEQAERHRQEMEEIAGSFEASVRGIVQIVSGSAAGVQDSAADLAALSERGMERSSAVALAAERASGNVAAVARSADQLGGAIVRIGRHAEDSLGITREAEAQTAAIRTVMTELGGAVRKIGDVVDLVSGIAHNTNLLALNATIEAARAGEMGKGFAVVAGEVKALSDQTAKATHEISAQIAAIQGVTGQAADSADVIAGIVGRIAELASTISGEVEQQEGASRDILDSINGAAADTRDVSDTIAAVRADSAGTGEASKLLLDAARQLAEQAAHLREDVDRFIAHVRSA